MRITGFAQGFDTQAMVNALMEVERTQQYRLDSMAYEEEQKLSAWNSVESSVAALETKVEELTSYSTWQQMVASASNEDVLTVTATGDAAPGAYDIDVTTLATSHRIGSDAQTAIDTALGLSGDFTVGGQSIAVAVDDTLADIRDAVNAAGLNMTDSDRVRAVIVDTTLVLEREATGATDISVAEGTGDVLEALGVLDATKTVKNELTAAQDLQATVSGVAITRSSNSGLEDVIADVTLNFHSEGKSTFTVDHDTETIKTLITDFVSAYNSAMSTIEAKGEAEVGGEQEVTAATLQGDSLLRTIQSKSRDILTASDETGTLDPQFDTLRKIGIWTSSRENRLAITDDEVLDDALANHFAQVEDLFRDFDAGILRQYDDYLHTLTSSVEGAINRRQSTIQDKIDGYDERIADMERSLVAYEEQLWEQFTTMESIIAGLQSQSSFLGSLLSSPTNGSSNS